MSKLVFDEEKAQRLTEALGRAERALSDMDGVVREVAVEREVQRSQEDQESVIPPVEKDEDIGKSYHCPLCETGLRANKKFCFCQNSECDYTVRKSFIVESDRYEYGDSDE